MGSVMRTTGLTGPTNSTDQCEQQQQREREAAERVGMRKWALLGLDTTYKGSIMSTPVKARAAEREQQQQWNRRQQNEIEEAAKQPKSNRVVNLMVHMTSKESQSPGPASPAKAQEEERGSQLPGSLIIS
ncbi:hypothetical protein J0S82_011883 [Galemys pyrenaicus]|uniref:Uncharacterized protein n=1 Tax=Galemys pyrenaicus TaxID=202257 RepID=A0A8J6ACG5_GALPY|nr:hypothetical protein J0S82_011883 [Galemys pyrenaicus]